MSETGTVQRKTIQQLKADYRDRKLSLDLITPVIEAVDAELKSEIERITNEHKLRHAEAYESYTSVRERAEAVESELRNLCVEFYKATGEKMIDENLSVRVNTKYDIDQPAAVEWAETNMPVAILKSVDKKMIEATAKNVTLPFVYITETPSAVIKGL